MELENKEFKWYMISTVSGKEDNVIEALKNKIEAQGMNEYFREIRIFKMPHLSNKELEKKTMGEEYKISYVNIYKGYIFLNMVMTDDAWYLVRNTQYVTGLIGSSGKGAKPTPISERNFQKMVQKESDLIAKFNAGDIETAFKEGTLVKIKSGIFKDQAGEIIKNNDITQKAFVNIEQFGRKVPTEFSYDELEICG
ncbi:transcription termination/antitermination protein NusG [Metamycoplasma spumans]|uniref:transcription termination/antitermination protein NusG n=1 Tax=Metamycoplasma spumans TaxID=92406 RepID=UPI0004836719